MGGTHEASDGRQLDEKRKMKTNKKKKKDRLDELDAFHLAIPDGENLPDESSAYDLAMLAAQILQGLRPRDVHEAIDTAWKLLNTAKIKLLDEFAKSPQVQERAKADLEEKKRKYLANLPLIDFNKGVKIITRQKRRDLAEDYFGRFLEFKHATKKAAEAVLRVYKEKGFNGTEVAELRKGFVEWWAQHRRKKGKQGCVKNPEKDRRTKPRPAAIPGIKGYFAE